MEIKEIKETKEEKQKMRKRNMKLFPIYKMLSWDLLFYYTINFLFLTQIKNISASNVVLIDSFYALFIMVLQIPINIIIAFLGKKKSLVIGNITLVIYMLIIIFSRNIFDLILANFISAIGFGINIFKTKFKRSNRILYTKYDFKSNSRIFIYNKWIFTNDMFTNNINNIYNNIYGIHRT